ncbi:MAG TPA: efflux RND transporter permease subunit [Tepidisphaeraceae bacterium]|jgi:multidrug efflux pump subunit AcrB|nr:efflux RND transporter permease subunit [Tepidisphaeraceae bacterium]
MSIVAFVLKRPYTVFAAVIVVCLLGIGAALRMPVDIFPEIDIPVVSVVWTYSGMSAQEIQDRILVKHERQMASLVDDISRIEANSYDGVGVIKVYLHQGADVSRAVSQLSSCAQTVLKSMPRNITPPLIIRYGATDVPVIQLGISSRFLPTERMSDFGQQVLRPDLAVVHGAQVPYPYGGKTRVIMVDLNMDAMRARGVTPDDVVNALSNQNLQAPSGDAKIGAIDYQIPLNNSTDTVEALNGFPVKTIGDATVFLRDVAHVRDGSVVQTNSVSQNGSPAALMTIRKTGGVSTLAVINGVRNALPDIERLLPRGMSIKALFDQSIYVKASLDSVIMGGMMAAGLTALMILLFLGNWRLTLIIVASIPLSIVAAILVMYCAGQTLNTMTLGGFALAVGILVDNSTVVIENIERHLSELRKHLEPGILHGAAEVAVPTLLSTLAICIVFVPIFLLQGTAKYLFSPLAMSVCISLLASLALSFTLVPVLFKYLLRSHMASHQDHERGRGHRHRKTRNPLRLIHRGFDDGFNKFRDAYRTTVIWCVARPVPTVAFFLALMAASCFLFPRLGENFFPQIDAGQMRLHVRAPPGTRIERTQAYFSRVESAIRRIVGNNQIDVILDNIGLPYSGINIALSDSATVGPMDGEILISLKHGHTPTAQHMKELRRQLPKLFPQLTFFFQPADMVNQVLNFGQAAPIDIRVSGPSSSADYAAAVKLMRDIRAVPGIVDAHIFQVPDAPALKVDVDRTMADQMGMSQRDVSNSVLVALSSSAMVSPNFWVNPKNNVTYPLLVQTPQYRVDSLPSLLSVPVARNDSTKQQLLMNVAKVHRGTVPMILSELNIRPVFDVQANPQSRDLGGIAHDLNRVIAADAPAASTGIHVQLSGQIQTMQESFDGLFGGMGLAVVLVYLLMVIQFQSWLDPLIVLLAAPFALAGVMWMLYFTGTHISVPALMGTLMCIGLATANSILVVTFANDRIDAGDDKAAAAATAGFTRLRPVLMTAGAMILGMIPMALGVGEGGEQNAPLARAVIGGLLFATFATLVFVPSMFRLLSRHTAPHTAQPKFEKGGAFAIE